MSERSPASQPSEGAGAPARRTPHERLLAAGLAPVGPAAGFADDIHRLMADTPLFAGLDIDQSRRLAGLMFVYEAIPGTEMIGEGDAGDFLMLLMSGLADVLRRNRHGYPARIAVASPGHCLGEMSLFDGEPRFASCVALERSRIAVLTRDAVQRVLADDPVLGNKILLRTVQLLSERLRQTSAKLVTFLDAARDT